MVATGRDDMVRILFGAARKKLDEFVAFTKKFG